MSDDLNNDSDFDLNPNIYPNNSLSNISINNSLNTNFNSFPPIRSSQANNSGNLCFLSSPSFPLLSPIPTRAPDDPGPLQGSSIGCPQFRDQVVVDSGDGGLFYNTDLETNNNTNLPIYLNNNIYNNINNCNTLNINNLNNIPDNSINNLINDNFNDTTLNYNFNNNSYITSTLNDYTNNSLNNNNLNSTNHSINNNCTTDNLNNNLYLNNNNHDSYNTFNTTFHDGLLPNFNNKSLNILSFNINGLVSKVDMLMDYFKKYKINIGFIQETNITSHVPPMSNIIYNGLKSDTHGANGIAIWADPAIKHLITIIKTHHCYTLIKTFNIYICNLYIPHGLTNPEVRRLLNDIINFIPEGCQFILCGDLNSRFGIGADKTITERRNIFFDTDFPLFRIKPVIDCFTRIGRRSDRLELSTIDHVFTNQPFNGKVIVIDKNCRSDHFPLFIHIPLESMINYKNFTRWNILKFAEPDILAKFKNYLQINSPEVVHSLQNNLHLINNLTSNFTNDSNIDPIHKIVNDSFASIINLIHGAGAASVGHFRYCYSSPKDFWTQPLKDAEKDMLEAQSLYDNADPRRNQNRRFYKILLNNRTKVFNNLLEKRRKSKHKDFWLNNENVNHLSGIKLMKNLKARESGGSSKLDPSKMSEYSSYFGSTFGQSPSGNVRLTNHDLLHVTNPLWFDDTEIFWSEDDIKGIIMGMKSGKAGGSDQIPIEFLKNGVAELVPVLNLLYILCWKTNYIPDKLSEALICPIFKNKDSPYNVKNYRPIALTSVLRKIYEHLILKLFKPLSYSKLNPLQGGFLTKRSTLQQIHLLDLIMNKYPTSVVGYLDIKAAYDTINRSILYTYLSVVLGSEFYYLIRRIRSLFDFNLSYLVVNGNRSSGIANLRGLLQGSPMSPLLFNWYIDSLILVVQSIPSKINISPLSTLNIILYADDCAVISDTHSNLQLLINTCSQWCDDHGLQLAANKSKIVTNTPDDIPVLINNSPLEIVPKFKYLGIIFDNSGIAITANIERCSRLINMTVGWLGKRALNKKSALLKTSSRIFKTFIQSRLEYGLSVMKLNKGHIGKLEKIYNRGLRSIINCSVTTSIDALCILSNNLPFNFRFMELQGRYYYQLIQLYNNFPNIPIVSILNFYRNSNSTYNYTKKLLKPFNNNDFLKNLINIPDLSYWQNIQLTRLNLFERKLCADYDELNVNIPGSIVGLSSAVPGTLIYSDIRRPKIFNLKLSKSDQKLLITWMIGKVAIKSRTCDCNHVEMSRKNLIICSGVHTSIINNYPHLISKIRDDPAKNSLDIYLNQFLRRNPTHVEAKFACDMIKRMFSHLTPDQPVDYG